MVTEVLQEWNRLGAQGLREAIWALPPENQIRVLIDLYNRRELEPLVAAIDDDFVHDMRPTGIPGMELYYGPAGYGRFLTEWLDAFPDSSLEIESIEFEGAVLISVVRQEVHGAGSGVPVAFTYAAVLTFEDGRARQSEFHMDLDEARARFDDLAGARRR